MVQGLLGSTLGSFTPLLTAAVPLVIANFVKSPMVKIAAQTAAAVELSQLIGGVGGLLSPSAGWVGPTQPAQLPTTGIVKGDDDSIPPPLGR